MKAAEIKKLIAADLTPFYAEHGYQKKAQIGTVASYRQEIDGGYRTVIIQSRTVHFATQLWIVYGVRFFAVEALMELLKPTAELSAQETAIQISIGTAWYNAVRDGSIRTWIPEVWDEETYTLAREAVKTEFLTYGLPFLNWVQSVNQIDSVINGEPFWNEETGHSTEGWWFTVRDFVIGRLAFAKAANNPDFERVVKLNLENINRHRILVRHPQKLEADDMTHPVPRAAAFLRAL